MAPTADVHDRVWLITGASAGFGRALAQEVLQRGGRAIATARDPSSLAALAAAGSERLLALALDVTQPRQIDRAVVSGAAHFGRIDVLVNNAGYGFLSGLEEGTDEEARAQFDVNFFGTVSMTRAVLPLMRRERSGHIVNFSSSAGVFGVAGSAYYCATKFAVEGLSECLAREVSGFGIGVTIVEPGPFRTDFFGRSLALPAHPIADYSALADMRRQLGAAQGQQPGDPARGAAAIIDAVTSPSPPLRLVLGRGAHERIRRALALRLEQVDACREVAASADFPELP